MSEIQNAVAMSDTHLGRDVGYLCSSGANNRSFRKNKAVLIDMLNDLGPQDELILNGDILELALGGYDQVYRDVRSFFEILSETGPFKRIVYIPGNHDHIDTGIDAVDDITFEITWDFIYATPVADNKTLEAQFLFEKFSQ